MIGCEVLIFELLFFFVLRSCCVTTTNGHGTILIEDLRQQDHQGLGRDLRSWSLLTTFSRHPPPLRLAQGFSGDISVLKRLEKVYFELYSIEMYTRKSLPATADQPLAEVVLSYSLQNIRQKSP
jgi:hypothetical protein